MDDKKKLIRESVRYLQKPTQKIKQYSHADIVVYRLWIGKGWTNRERRRSWLKIGVGGVLCAVGGATVWCPFTGSLFMIGFGCSLIVGGCLDFWGYYKKKKQDLRFYIWRLKNVEKEANQIKTD